MTASPTTDLALAHRTCLLQQTVALGLQPVLSESEQTRLVQNLLELDMLDKTIEQTINHHLTRLYAVREALGFMLELLDETERRTVPASSIGHWLTPWHKEMREACSGIAALF
jgi:hypothetical protein